MFAAHFVCRRRSGQFANLTAVAVVQGIYRSGFWNLSTREAETLVGGWLYLHDEKTEASVHGGEVLRWRKVIHRGAERIEFELRFSPSAQGQAWRGKAYARASTGGLIPADLEHEKAAQALARPAAD